MKKEQMLLIGIVIVVAVMIFIPKERVTEIPDGNLSEFLVATADFDTNNEALREVALSLKGPSDRDTVKSILQYVYENIQYDGEVSTSYCYNEKASDVLIAKKGDCVSMTKLTVTMLRINNIAARSKGGCVAFATPCQPIMSFFPVNPIPMSMVQDNKKRGFLHEWAEAYIGGKWVLLETTANRILDDSCSQYLTYSYDSDVYDRCAISDWSFIDQCGAFK